jgi:protein TonB
MKDLNATATVRRSGVLLLALMINFLLFVLMQQMVAGRRIELSDMAGARIIDFIRVPDHLETQPQRRLRKKAPEPPEPPEPPPKQIRPQMEALQQPLPQPLPRLKIDAPQAAIDSDGPYLGGIALKVPGFIMAHDLVAILRRPPPYPRLLKRRGIEGYALVEFTVTAQGLVQDPVIIESHPHEGFGKSVMRTVRYWKFKPYRIDDQPVAVRARQGIDFTME